MTSQGFLIFAAGLSATAGVLHLAIIAGGARWYRFFGAGERMARMAEAGRAYPAVATLGIAAVLFLWSAFALSGAGAIGPLPWTRVALVAITAVYLLRGLLFVPALALAHRPVTPFAWWSSVICLGFGLVHLAGLLGWALPPKA